MTETLQAAVQAAKDEISRICEGSFSGNYRWHMSIPARDSDSDLVISTAIESLEARLRDVEAERDALDETTNLLDDATWALKGMGFNVTLINELQARIDANRRLLAATAPADSAEGNGSGGEG